MSSGVPDLFGVPLRSDPAKALRPIRLNTQPKSGPLHKVQFVIEFVGPRSIPATAVSRLLDADWFRALGSPSIFAMRPSDLQWQVLTPSKDGSYDSLALAWDLITPFGSISSAAALQLLQFAERFAPHIARRAMPMPQPADVNQVVTHLLEARDALDIGVELTVNGPMEEKAIWIECAQLGLEFSPEGTFDWRAQDHGQPLLSVSPIGNTDTFSLAGVQSKSLHQGVTIGFSVPLCAAPVQALEASIYVAERIALDLGGTARDDEDRALNEMVKTELRTNLKQALGQFSNLGFTTGSPEAVKLFHPTLPT